MTKSHPNSYRRNPIKRAFKAQQDASKVRSIEFLFTFEEWIDWWCQNLGPDWFKKRGRLRGKYCMARKGDTGPYASWNVKCILSEHNALERKDTGSLLYGERHGMCRIDARTAQAIYVADGPKTAIGKIYGVSRFSVSNIKSGSNWRRATRRLKKGQTREGRVRLHLLPSRKLC